MQLLCTNLGNSPAANVWCGRTFHRLNAGGRAAVTGQQVGDECLGAAVAGAGYGSLESSGGRWGKRVRASR